MARFFSDAPQGRYVGWRLFGNLAGSIIPPIGRYNDSGGAKKAEMQRRDDGEDAEAEHPNVACIAENGDIYGCFKSLDRSRYSEGIKEQE